MNLRRRCKAKDCQEKATHGRYCYECAVKTPAPLWKG